MLSNTRKFAFTAMLATGLAVLPGFASAQDFTFGWNPRSGDVWVDTWLDDMNRYGRRYRDPFIDEMVRYHGAPRSLVGDLLGRRWAPGDVYMACTIASIIGRPCRYVADIWERDHGRGWGAVAKDLGIKPGSAEFHRLKKGFVPSYDRWGRGITLDTQLQRDFPGRGKGASNAKARSGSKGHADHRGRAKAGGRGNAKVTGRGSANAKGNSGAKGNRGNKGNGRGKGKDKGGH